MAITTAWCTSHKAELPQALHNHSVGGNAFKAALYLASANLDSTTTAYTATGEVTGTGYTAGGENCTNITPLSTGTTAYWQFQNVTWSTVTISDIAGVLFYNSTNANRSVSCEGFAPVSVTANDFTLLMPTNDATSALYRLV